MDSGLYAVVNGARRMSLRMDTLANNLANANTTGFKQDQVMFDSYMTQPGIEQFPLPTDSFLSVKAPGDVPFPFSNPAANAHKVTYPMATEAVTDTTQGALQKTGGQLDLAIQGEGYFKVMTPEGVRYTRDGSFTRGANGDVVNMEGHALLGAGDAPINLGEVEVVMIRPDGTISDETGANLGQVVRVGLAEDRMEKAGNSLYTAAADAEQPLDDAPGGIIQYHLEASNVNGIHNMTKLIETQRHFQNYMKMIQAMDGLDEKAVNQIGRLQG